MNTVSTHNDRPNTDRAGLVDAAVSIQLEHGPQVAARFLTSGGVSFATTVRVLSEPSRRRPRASATRRLLLPAPS